MTNFAFSLWTLPNTVIGFFVGLFLAWSIPTFDFERGYWKFCSGRGLSGWVRRNGTWATTLGQAVIFWREDKCDDEPLLEHELVHVRQYNTLGPFFLLLYLPLVPFFGGKKNHPMERRAYARQAEVQARLDAASQS